MGYRAETPYYCWYGMGSQWDVPWDGIFLRHPNGMSHWDPIGMLFLEVYLRATLLAAAAESHLGAILGAI